LLPYDIARYVFFTLSVSVTFCTIPLLFANRDKDYRKELILIGWFAAFLFFPNYFSLYNGQINSLLFFFCALALFFIRKKRLWLAGLFVALASLIKIFPLVLLPFFVFKRQYKLIGITLVLIILLVSLSVLVSDFELYTIFFTEALPRQFSAGPHYRNQGFVGFFTRLLTQNQYTQSIGDYPNTAYLLASISSVIILGSTVLCTRWKPDSGTFRYEIEYGFYFVAALLILAKSHEHFAMFLLFSFLFLFEFLAYGRPSGQALLFFVSVSFCVWAFVLTGGVEYDQLPKNILMNLVVSSKFIATLLLFVCNVWILRRKGEANLLAPVGAPPASSQSLTGV
jgi:hypothetical protein